MASEKHSQPDYHLSTTKLKRPASGIAGQVTAEPYANIHPTSLRHPTGLRHLTGLRHPTGLRYPGLQVLPSNVATPPYGRQEAYIGPMAALCSPVVSGVGGKSRHHGSPGCSDQKIAVVIAETDEQGSMELYQSGVSWVGSGDRR